MNNHNDVSRRMLARVLSFVAALAACASLGASAAGLAQSCADIRAANPAAVDGDYIIAPGGDAFTVYCNDMAGSPGEYLSLVHTGGAYNYSLYGYINWWDTNVVTHYTRVRLDPATLRVDIGDQTFATSTGYQCCIGSTPIASMPYANAGSCIGGPDGDANVDLTGTPFKVSGTFTLDGWFPYGSVNGSWLYWGETRAVDTQVVDLTGGGYCGGLGPNAGGNINDQGGFALQLAYLGNPGIGKDTCKGGGFAAFGVFRNQGDCVSFFATRGRNGPATGG